jgi:hypothetical protein
MNSDSEESAVLARSVDVLLALFRANRDHGLLLLQHVPDAWQRSVRMRTPDGRPSELPSAR